MTIWKYEAEGINTIYPDMINACMDHGVKVTQRGLTTRELSPVVFQLWNPRRRLVTSYGRPVNVAFALAEVLWILNGQQDVASLAPYNSRIADFSDDGETFNAAYGHRMRYAFGHDQLVDCIATLQDDRGSRQAVLQINHPRYDKGWANPCYGEFVLRGGETVEGPIRHITKDRACNVSAHMLIRDGQLSWTQFMRSNDALWGTPYNIIQWTHVQEYVTASLGVGVGLGRYNHVSDSFHIYDPPLDGSPLPDVAPFDLYEALGTEHAPMTEQDTINLPKAAWMAKEISEGGVVGIDTTSQAFWTPFMTLLLAHRHYVGLRDSLTYELLRNCPDQIYGAAQLRFYVYNRWGRHPERYSDLLERLDKDYPSEVVRWMLGERP